MHISHSKRLEAKESKKYLDIVKDIKNSHTLYDIHTHPMELIYRQGDYRAELGIEGVYTTTGSRWTIPQIKDAILRQNGNDKRIFNLFSQSDLFLKNLSKTYSHTGPTVFEMQMALSHIDKVLLLPVAPAVGSVDYQMDEMEKMFGRYQKFCFGWSVPNSVSNEAICASAEKAFHRFDIKAIKLHPNITKIDVNSKQGKDRVDRILNTCRELSLPLIVHGGMSHLAGKSETSAYSDINHLSRIDWSSSCSTVVIAHAGAYNCEYSEIENHILPALDRLLLAHENLMIDVSGLDIDALILVLRRINIDRILFGSDALYEPQWLAVVKLLIGLKTTMKNFEEAFIRITSINPAQSVFG